MKTYKIKIKNGKQTLHSALYGFKVQQEAHCYALGLCEGFGLAGMKPTKLILKEVKD